MLRLNVGELIHITNITLKVLAQNRITTILEFLQEDTEKLARLTGLSLAQVLEIRNNILLKHAAPLITGTTLLINNDKKRKFISSGIQSLDNLTKGGIPVGYTTEICGLANSGKTQLCLQLAINCVKNSVDSVLYVDTKGDFSAIRIQKILSAHGYEFKDIVELMDRLRVIHVWTMDEMLELLKKLKDKVLSIDNLRLIIIDSISCLMFQFLGDDNKIGLTFLNTLVNYSRYLSKEMEMAVICVNIQTRWMDTLDVDGLLIYTMHTYLKDDGDLSAVSKECTEKRNRCLGKYWQNIPALILILEKMLQTDDKETKIKVSVAKSFHYECDQKCILILNNLGIR